MRTAVASAVFFIAALGYNFITHQYGKAGVVIFVLTPVACFLLNNPETSLVKWKRCIPVLLFLQAYVILGMIPLLVEYGLTTRLAYNCMYPMAIFGAYLIGKTYGYDIISRAAFVCLLIFVIYGSYELFSDTYLVSYTSPVDSDDATMVTGTPWFERRVASFSGNANIFATLALFIMLFNFGSSNAMLRVMSIFLGIFAVLAQARSRTGVVCISVAFILWYLRNKKPWVVGLLLAAYLGIGVAGWLYIESDRDMAVFSRAATADMGMQSIDNRLQVNCDALGIWLNHYFLVGAGVDAESLVMPLHSALRAYTESIYVKIPLEYGLLGVVFLISALCLRWKTSCDSAHAKGHKVLFVTFVFVWLLLGVAETAALYPPAMLPIAIMFGAMF
jgi:hypothetical protein